jgi:N-hydroxyarylamine O-acetyltransferase
MQASVCNAWTPAGGASTTSPVPCLDLQDDALLARGCRWLQQDAGSPFRQNVVIQRHGRQLLHSLVNRSYSTLANGQTCQQELRDAQELAHLLETCFGLPPQDAAAIWERLDALQRQPCPAGDPS